MVGRVAIGWAFVVSSVLLFFVFLAVLFVGGSGSLGAQGTESEEAADSGGDRQETQGPEAQGGEEGRGSGEEPSEPEAVGADESGMVMVLEYHRVGGDPGLAPDWTISPEDFRAQLELLHENDYYPINLRDLLDNRVDVPAGKTPVVLTFDDSSDTQFTMVQDGEGWVPDPDGAVGILQQFHEENPDWPMSATFFVLPEADPPNDLFGQPELAGEKLEFLVENGMEVGNHTLYHANLAQSAPEEVQRQLALANAEIQSHLPDYEVVSLSPPFGEYPQDMSLIRSGSWEGEDYEMQGAVEVAGGATVPPGHRQFDPYRIPRIQAEPHKGHLAELLAHFEANPEDRYVSDGDPETVTVPEENRDQIDGDALRQSDTELRAY
ncbi:MAG: polysaccharide deacetylase family protein [Rubrobacter sp.]|nr:polysaccharide deacetylase family protein [Rubrobacter sp.]